MVDGSRYLIEPQHCVAPVDRGNQGYWRAARRQAGPWPTSSHYLASRRSQCAHSGCRRPDFPYPDTLRL